ncbi:hypothetical protein ACHAXR_000985, partial [Thalassiosira sp. AJA248-18]
ESHPVETAEYAVAQGLELKPAFNWWVSYVLRKRARIISLLRQCEARYLKTVKKTYELDPQNGNTFWADAISKEMKNVKVAFKMLDDDETVPQDYQFVRCHMIFDVKMEDFRRKARFVAGGHMTKAPAAMTYASVVSREMFGEDAGKKAIIVCAIYGLKSSGAAFRKHLGECMSGLGYKPCLAGPDLWLKPQSRDAGTSYYSYILCYVDGVLVVDDDAQPILDRINKFMKLKGGSSEPDIYLGAKLKKITLANDVAAWSMSPSKYVQEAVRNCEKHVKENFTAEFELLKYAPDPFPIGYEPEMDVSRELTPDEASYFQTIIIGVMRWMVELGRVDIGVE